MDVQPPPSLSQAPPYLLTDDFDDADIPFLDILFLEPPKVFPRRGFLSFKVQVTLWQTSMKITKLLQQSLKIDVKRVQVLQAV